MSVDSSSRLHRPSTTQSSTSSNSLDVPSLLSPLFFSRARPVDRCTIPFVVRYKLVISEEQSKTTLVAVTGAVPMRRSFALTSGFFACATVAFSRYTSCYKATAIAYRARLTPFYAVAASGNSRLLAESLFPFESYIPTTAAVARSIAVLVEGYGLIYPLCTTKLTQNS